MSKGSNKRPQQADDDYVSKEQMERIKTVLVRVLGDNVQCPECGESFIPFRQDVEDLWRELKDD